MLLCEKKKMCLGGKKMCLTGLPSMGTPPFRFLPSWEGTCRARHCRCLITSAHFRKMAAEVTKQTQRGSQPVVRWRAAEAHLPYTVVG